MKTECFACGGDCSNSYATYDGYPHHVMCLPAKRKKSLPEKVEESCRQPAPGFGRSPK